MIKSFLYLCFVFIIGSTCSLAQEPYNNCSNAQELCPGEVYSLNNINANSTVCNGCEDDFNFCFTGENTIWMYFSTNENGGDVLVDFSHLNFQNNAGQGQALQAAIIEAVAPCSGGTYTLISNCISNGINDFTLIANNLPANTTYYVIVNGQMGTTKNAEAQFDVQLSGTGVQRQASLSIQSDDLQSCYGEMITFRALLKGCKNPSTYRWYEDGNYLGSTEDSVFQTADLSDGGQITAQVTCFKNCKDTIISNSLKVTIDSFLVDAGDNQYIEQGESIQLQGKTSGTFIQWQPSTNMSNSKTIRPIVHPQETTNYFLTVSNGNCSITDEVTVYVNKGLTIPNTFSPNGDGINDTWEILGISKFPDCEIIVYDRWGQLVFQSRGYPNDKQWDGTSKGGRKLSVGAYYYVINLHENKGQEALKGVVTIIR